jgi:hypothetical protein
MPHQLQGHTHGPAGPRQKVKRTLENLLSRGGVLAEHRVGGAEEAATGAKSPSRGSEGAGGTRPPVADARGLSGKPRGDPGRRGREHGAAGGAAVE